MIDQSIVEQIKFIREGQFVEKAGAPALKLIGEVAGVLDKDKLIYAESAYPYTASHVLAECSINQYDFQALTWKYAIRGNVRYHMEISTGQKSKINKYSKALVELLRNEMRNDPDIVQKVRNLYRMGSKNV